MYTISALFKTYLSQPGREFEIKAVVNSITYLNTSVIEFDIADSIIPSDGLTLGSAVSSRIDMKLKTTDTIVAGSKIQPYVRMNGASGYTEWVPVGVFYVDTQKFQNGVWSITGFDKLVFSQKPYVSTLTYPALMSAMMIELTTTLGITVNSSVVINPAYSVTYNLAGITIHDMIGYIAAAHSACVRVTKDEKLAFVKIAPGATTTVLSASDYFKADITNPLKTCTCVALGSDTDSPALIAGSGDADHTISIYNPLMNQTMLNDVLATINGFSYTPFTMDWKGRPDLEVGDAIYVTMRDGTIFTSTITTNKMSFKGGLKTTSGSPSSSSQKSANDYGGSVSKQISKDVLQCGTHGGSINTGVDVTPSITDRAAIRLVPGTVKNSSCIGYVEVLEDGSVYFYKDDCSGNSFAWIKPDGTTNLTSSSGGGEDDANNYFIHRTYYDTVSLMSMAFPSESIFSVYFDVQCGFNLSDTVAITVMGVTESVCTVTLT